MALMTSETQDDPAAEGYAPSRGVLRTLRVLRALNHRNGATVLELARLTGISRGALYRILETLREAGYVALDLAGHSYELTMLVRGLAEGFVDEDWIGEVARPELRALQREIVWPVDLGTFNDGGMWIRETTRPRSPFTIDRGVVGLRFPVLLSATGRAYLAWCPEGEREAILAGVVRTGEPGGELVRDRPRLNASFAQTRAQGYGLRFGEEPVESGAIAVPIVIAERVIGCVNMTFSRRAIRPEEAAARCLSAMQAAAARIAEGASRPPAPSGDAA